MRSQVTPARSGWASASYKPWSMVRAPTTPTTPTIAPTRAGATGMLARPFPRSNAIVTPRPTGSGAHRRMRATAGWGLHRPPPACAELARRATTNVAPTTATNVRATPGPITVQSMWVPTSGSIWRPRPTGNQREASTALPNATAAATAAVRAWLSPAAVAIWLPVRPIERRTTASSAMTAADRMSAWATNRLPATVMAAPSSRSAVRSTDRVVVTRRSTACRSSDGVPGPMMRFTSRRRVATLARARVAQHDVGVRVDRTLASVAMDETRPEKRLPGGGEEELAHIAHHPDDLQPDRWSGELVVDEILGGRPHHRQLKGATERGSLLDQVLVDHHLIGSTRVPHATSEHHRLVDVAAPPAVVGREEDTTRLAVDVAEHEVPHREVGDLRPRAQTAEVGVEHPGLAGEHDRAWGGRLAASVVRVTSGCVGRRRTPRWLHRR